MRSTRLKTSLLALSLLFALPASAHKAWLLPSASVLPEQSWISVDAAVSNDLFNFNHVALRLDALQITAPDGSSRAPANPATGKFRSMFDLELSTAGTWRLALVNQGFNASWKEGGEQRRWRGPADQLASAVPSKAEDLVIVASSNRVETFVTAGAPDTRALAATGKGLELVPVTHPNDLFEGETANFVLQLDGKPAAGIEVLVMPGGTRYRNESGERRIMTSADGRFSIEWPQAGLYWINASVVDDKASAPATQRRASYSATFEVLPQ